jgi:uncharacterized damage-inducible protein DinB
MHGYGGKDLARAFRTVRRNTIKIAEEIPEDQYGFSPAPGVRTVRETLAHIVTGTPWTQQLHGVDHLSFVDFAYYGAAMAKAAEQEAALTTKPQILDALKQEEDAFGSWLESLSDDFLAEPVGFPPPLQPSSKSRFEMLLAVKEHEMHHRGQLMVIERMLGIVPHLTRDQQARRAEMATQRA